MPEVRVYCRGGGGKYVGRWLPEENCPIVDGDHNPGLVSAAPISADSLLLGEEFLSAVPIGELGRLPYGELVDPLACGSVKRNNFADNCQNIRREMNISDHPSGVFSSGFMPTEESSDVTKPILSSFWIKLRPRRTPSRLILMRQSAFGFPASGVFFEASVTRWGDGSGW